MYQPTDILILGAGELGLPVLSSLATHPLRRKSNLSVLLRSPPRPSLSPLLSTWNISTVLSDIASATADNLSAVFARFDTVICCTGMGLPAGTQLKIAKAVLATPSVKRYLPWQFGVNYDVIGSGSGQDWFDEQLEVRRLLRAQQEKRWVIVSTGIFMSFLFEESFGVVTGLKQGSSLARSKVRALGKTSHRITVTDVGDIGKVVTEVVLASPETEGVIYTSGQTVRYDQLVQILSELSGRETDLEEWSAEQLTKELKDQPSDGMRKYRLAFADGKGVAWDDETTWDKQRGLKLLDIRAWCQKHALLV